MASFFSWGSSHKRSNDLPTGGSSFRSNNVKGGHDDDDDDDYVDDDSNAPPPPLSASSPRPTTLGYQPPPQEAAAAAESVNAPPTAYPYGGGNTGPTAALTATSRTTAGGDAAAGVHIFIPPQAQQQAASSAAMNDIDDDDDDDHVIDEELPEDSSWVETSAASATAAETPQDQRQNSTETDEPLAENPSYNYYYNSSINNNTPIVTELYDSPTPPQQSSNEYIDGHANNNQEGARGADEWEQVQGGGNEDLAVQMKDLNVTGPGTLETVPVAEEQQEPSQGHSPTSDFEWVTAAPSEEPSIMTANSGEFALRTKNPQGSKGGKDTTNPSSETLVVSRGLPPFTRSVQKGLNKLQEKTARRQHEVRTRIHAVQCQMARWTAGLAAERMDRQESLQHFMSECVYQPAGELIDRVDVEKQKAQNVVEKRDGDDVNVTKHVGYQEEIDDNKYGNARGQPRWRAAEARLNALETQMARSAHALSKARREKLVSLHDRLIYDVMPRIWQERAQAAARESALLDQVDKLAGQFAARSMEERAAREVTMTMANSYLQKSEINYEERQQALLVVLANVRADLTREKEERQQQDEVVQQQLMEIMTALRCAILEAVGDPQD